jgi:hypothetical protein
VPDYNAVVEIISLGQAGSSRPAGTTTFTSGQWPCMQPGLMRPIFTRPRNSPRSFRSRIGSLSRRPSRREVSVAIRRQKAVAAAFTVLTDPERAAKIFPWKDTQDIREEIDRVCPTYKGIANMRKKGDNFQYGGPRLLVSVPPPRCS